MWNDEEKMDWIYDRIFIMHELVYIGVSKETFNNLIAGLLDEGIDYSVLNLFLPHPHYSRQHFVCILNPVGDNAEKTKQLIIEAHLIAEGRLQRNG